MTIVSHLHPFVVGVDTHARSHVLCLMASSGEHISTQAFPTTHPGMARAISWVARRTHADPDTLWAVEGAGSYGCLLTQELQERGYQVVEAPRMNPRARHGIGKSDTLDARSIATAVLTLDTHHLRHPRRKEGVREAVRILITARDLMSKERTSNYNALTALLRIVDLGVDARKAPTPTQVAGIAKWRTRSEDLAHATARAEARRLAQRIQSLDTDLHANNAHLEELLQDSPARPLLTECGIGPVTAGICLVAWSHPGRCRNEAAFASLAGTNPIPASSGNTVRSRLNPGGDRQLNRAVHIIALTRMTHDPETRAYVQRRLSEGKTTREIRRCLKRYIARHIYRTLNTTTTPPTPA